MQLDERVWRAIKGPLQWRAIWVAHAKFNVGCHGLVRDGDGRVLLVKNRMWPIGKQWGAPGGYAKAGEVFAGAVAREVHEETGFVVAAEDAPILVKSGYRLRCELWFRAELTGGTQRLEPREILEAGWFDVDDLPDEVHPAHRRIIEANRGWWAPGPARTADGAVAPDQRPADAP